MILALEAADSWRLTCSECTPDQQKKRGCHKPGFEIALHGSPFRFDSPALQPRGADRGLPILYECPVGFTLREAPWVYKMIDACSRDENLAPSDLDGMSEAYRVAARIFHAERARLFDRRRRRQQADRDVAVGAAVRRGSA